MSIYCSSIIHFLNNIIPKSQPSNNLPMAGFEIEMSSFAPFGGLARCRRRIILWRRQGAKRHGLFNGGALALHFTASDR